MARGATTLAFEELPAEPALQVPAAQPWAPGAVVDLPLPKASEAPEPSARSSAEQVVDTTAQRTGRDRLLRRLLAAGDVVGALVALVVVGLLRPPLEATTLAYLLLLSLPIWVVANRMFGIYHRDSVLVHKSSLDELPAIARSVTIFTLTFCFFAPIVTEVRLDRGSAGLFWLTALVVVPSLRGIARTAWVRATAPERCVVLGSGPVAELVATKLGGHPEHGIELVGYLDADEHVGGDVDLPRLGDLEDFVAICARERIDRIVIAFTSLPYERTSDLVRTSRRLGLKVSVIPRLYEVLGYGVQTDHVEGLTIHGMLPSTRTTTMLALKRAIDIAGASAGLLVLSPLLLAAAATIKLTSPGPVLFRQERMGRGQRTFRMLKLRTMVQDAEARKDEIRHLNEMAGDGEMFKMVDDPRITRVGRLLRRTSFDEVPQLLNVLRGEMSLVGPRPLVLDEDAHVLGFHRERLELKPGLTGPWQVMGRNAIPFQEMVKLDYLYVASWSLFNDVKLMLRTLPVVVGRRGS